MTEKGSGVVFDQEDIAIVGMACLLPGADTPAAFWSNIVGKVDCVTDPPPSWQAECFLDESGQDPDRAYTGKGGYVGDLCRFDPIKYGVMPNTVDGAEPDHFAALRCAHEALADAGFPNIPLNQDKAAVLLGRGTYVNRGYIGALLHTYGIDQLLNVLRQIEPDRDESELEFLKAELKRHLPPFNSETVSGLAHSVMVGRIANRLNLNGPAYTVDAACASSLVAVELGMQYLRNGQCDVALAGGVQVSTAAVIDILFCYLQAISRTGTIAPFSAEANGTLLGQGCGVVVLKRRSDAERDGNRIYAVVKSVGVSSDGRGGGLLAPLSDGQQLALERAYAQADIPPSTIGLIEAHGTGIPLGDATEVETLKTCFSGCGDGTSIAMGSVKSMISHLIPASGIASLIKTALSLYHRVLPPTLHAETADETLGLAETPFYLNTETRPWIHGHGHSPRRAGINAFGFGGINAHAILEEHQSDDETTAPSLQRDWTVELVVVSADDRPALRERLLSLASWIESAEGIRLVDVAASCARLIGPSRVAICASSLPDLASKIKRVAEMLADGKRQRIKHRKGMFWFEEPLADEGRVALVFPGEGAQYVGMLAELCCHFPEIRHEFDLVDAAFRRMESGRLPSSFLYPPPYEKEEAERRLFEMATAVEAVATADRALLSLLRRLGVRSDAVVGHSSGEFAALVAAGAVRIENDEHLTRLIIDGARCTNWITESQLVATTVLTTVGGAGVESVQQMVDESQGRLTIALDNCPHQTVIAGDEEATEIAVEQLKKNGALCERLPWDRAYHTDGFAPACEILDEYYQSVPIIAPSIEAWSCTTGEPYPDEPSAIRELAVRQWRSPVRFRETIQQMHDAGVRVFVEVGPRGNLSAFIEDILAGQPHEAVPLDLPRKGDIEQLCRAVGMLVAHGVDVDLDALYVRRQPQILDFSTAPPTPTSPDPVLRLDLPELLISEEVKQRLQNSKKHDESAPRTRSLPAATDIGTPTNSLARPPSRLRNGHARSRAFADYQETMRVFLEVQTRVMTGAANGRLGDNGGSLPVSQLRHANRVLADPASRAEPEIPQDVATNVQVTREKWGLPSVQHVDTPRTANRETVEAKVDACRTPLIDHVLEHDRENRLLAECELSVSKHQFLLDHTFGRTVSLNDPSLVALPVMPLAMTIELMAEAAVRLRPDVHVTSVHDLRALRWLAVADTSRRVLVEAIADGDLVKTTVYDTDREGRPVAAAEARLELAPALPQPPRLSLHVQPSQHSRWRPEDLYTRGLFHGPAFQSVRSIDAVSQGEVTATLRQPDPTSLLGNGRSPDLQLPVSLIDGAGQVIGFWGAEDDWTMGFPSGFERLELYDVRSTEGPLTASGRIHSRESSWTSDVELCTDDSEVILRVLGRKDRVLDIPAHFWRYRIAPQTVVFSRALIELFDGVPNADRCTICGLDDFRGSCLVEDSGFNALVLSHLILSRRERKEFAELSRPPAGIASWLLGRVAAKDAVRVHRRLDVCMADVEIQADEHGRPYASLAATDAPHVSVSHKGHDVVAVAADECRGIGIDVEPIRPLDPNVVEEAFDAEERSLIEHAAASIGEPPDVWWVSAWCAKEAIGKAFGRGIVGSPRNVRVIEIAAGEKRFTAIPVGVMADAVSQQSAAARHDRCDAFATTWGDLALALCILT